MATPVNRDLDMGSAAKILNLPTPTASGDAATKGYVDANLEGISWKDSVRVASVANINLASPGATIDGITMVSGDRFLAKDQTTGNQNGIYVWNGAATPATRAADMSTAAEVEQATTTVEEGTAAGATFIQTAVNVTLDTTTLTWSAFGSSTPAASESTAGKLEIATQGETDTGTDDLRAVTPLKLATYAGRLRKFTATFGDGSATSYVITHNLNTKVVQVYVYETGGSFREVICEKQHTSVNTVTILTATAPASGAYTAVVIG
jgi:hypothetical protein